MNDQRMDLCPEEILRELQTLALARATDFLAVRNGAVDIKSTDELPPELTAAIASVEKTSTGLRVKFYDKLKALELLGKYLGFFEPGTGRGQTKNNLLQAILESTRGELSVRDIPEIQQAAAAGHDLVEQAGSETI
jgi:hypothetical protein